MTTIPSTTGHRRVKITRWGCEDVRGAHCTWMIACRLYIGEVVDMYRSDARGCWMLKCKHMDGSPTPDVAATFVNLLERTYENADPTGDPR